MENFCLVKQLDGEEARKKRSILCIKLHSKRCEAHSIQATCQLLRNSIQLKVVLKIDINNTKIETNVSSRIVFKYKLEHRIKGSR